MDAVQRNRYMKKMSEFASQGKLEFWKPVEGRNQIRILPGFGPGTDFFKDYYCHFKYTSGGKNRALIGGAQFGKPEGYLEKYINALRSKTDELSRKELEQIAPSKQVTMFIVDRAHPEKGPQPWSTTENNCAQIIQLIVDPSYGDITTVKPDQYGKGARDIIIHYTPKDKSKTKFAQYKITPDASSSPLGTDDQITEWTSVDLFAKNKIGEPTDDEWVAAVFEGREEEYIAARKSDAAGTTPVPPDDVPLSSAPMDTVSYPPQFSSATKFWVFDDGAVKEIAFDDVCKLVMDGVDPKLMNYDQSEGWQAASEKEILKVVATSSNSPAAPAPPNAPPSAPSTPSPPSETEQIDKIASELEAKGVKPTSDAMTMIKQMLGK